MRSSAVRNIFYYHDLFFVCLDLGVLFGVARDLVVTQRVHRVYRYALPLTIVGHSQSTSGAVVRPGGSRRRMRSANVQRGADYTQNLCSGRWVLRPSLHEIVKL
jgi:hypothetical protein